jgi:hypothetical protein
MEVSGHIHSATGTRPRFPPDKRFSGPHTWLRRESSLSLSGIETRSSSSLEVTVLQFVSLCAEMQLVCVVYKVKMLLNLPNYPLLFPICFMS